MSDTIPVTLYLDPATKQRIDSLRPFGYTLNGFIRAAINEHLQRLPATQNPETLARNISHA